MIIALHADYPGFKKFRFKSGLNIILADRTESSQDEDTRNRSGKTSLVEVIHFLLGADARPDSIFRSSALSNRTFLLDFHLDGKPVRVGRKGSRYSEFIVTTLDVGQQNEFQPSGDSAILTAGEWRAWLGRSMFGIPSDGDTPPWSPSFRMVFPYFARRQNAGGFFNAFKCSSDQKTGSTQIATSYLLGLDTSLPREWQLLRERERGLAELKKAVGKEILGKAIGVSSQLRPAAAAARTRASMLQRSLETFQVHEQYRELEIESNSISEKLARLSDENMIDRAAQKGLEEAVMHEAPPPAAVVINLYREAGVQLGSLPLRRLEDVQRFHEAVVSNRQMYLNQELEILRARLAERDTAVRHLDLRRAEILRVLKSHGALEQYLEIQKEFSRTQAEADALQARYDAALNLESKSTEAAIERKQLLQRLRTEYVEAQGAVDRAIQLFQDFSRELYGAEHGRLDIEPTEAGPEFSLAIPGEESTGVNAMQIWALDMTIAAIWGASRRGPGFLIHDSHLFDSTDRRQVAKALAHGGKILSQQGWQYIVTMNSDALPHILPDGTASEQFVLEPRLTDATNEGGLFGFRFASRPEGQRRS